MRKEPNVLKIGGIEVQRVIEWLGPLKTVDEMFPDTPPESWTGELAPHHWVPQTRAYRAAIQSWVLRSADHTVLIDTGVGNDRDRPQVPSRVPLADVPTYDDHRRRQGEASSPHRCDCGVHHGMCGSTAADEAAV
jgi:hypothetical protein